MRPEMIFGMLDGYRPITNLLGAGDPNVHKIGEQWWMFFGGFQKSFKNNLFSASLPMGESLDSDAKWAITHEPGQPAQARPLIPQPSKQEWDGYGLHEPCYVEGRATNSQGVVVPCSRIYYTGRQSKSPLSNTSPFSIGFLEKGPNGWSRHPEPVVTGTDRNPNALGPKVVYADGKWRMWYRANQKEAVKGIRQQDEIYYIESEDGINGWSEPLLFFSQQVSIAHAYVTKTSDGYEMLVSTSPNLYGNPSYPDQKLWILKSDTPSGNREEWSTDPEEVLDARTGEPWYKGGFFGSSLCVPGLGQDEGARYVFFTGVHEPFHYLPYFLKRILSFRKPPIPAPFYFSIGCFKRSSGVTRS
ncbi:hypothetical protein [Paenibacillus sp. 1P07SE]|uniref:hypothetical protein n=1 Tax=Paenibacillus sp. 1P07SE TaxID=3132209 RepID=UPI0039A71D78